MAFIWYAGTPSDFGAQLVTEGGTSNLLQAAAVTLDIYTDRDTGSTLLTDTELQDDAGTGVSQVAGAVGEVIWFKADNTVTGDKTLYGTPDGGTTWYAFHPHNQTLVDRVTAAEAASSGSLGELSDVNTTGASDGDVLTYNAGTTTWAPGTSSGSGVPSGGTADQFLVKQSATAGDADWETHYTVPAGGADGALLAKASTSDGDTEWVAGDTYWKAWSGTQAEYDALTPDAGTLYAVTS